MKNKYPYAKQLFSLNIGMQQIDTTYAINGDYRLAWFNGYHAGLKGYPYPSAWEGPFKKGADIGYKKYLLTQLISEDPK